MKKSILRSPIFIAAVAALGIGGYFMSEPPAVGGGMKVVSKPKARTVKKGNVVFTKEDDQAKFERNNAPIRNAFVPIIAAGSKVGSGENTANVIPATFAGGDGNWVFTGSVEVDGRRQALLENRATGDGVFLASGQRWKSCSVKRVYSDSVVIAGPSGTMTFGLVSAEVPRANRLASSGQQPNGGFNPQQFGGRGGGLSGNIGQLPMVNGGQFSVSPNMGGGGRTIAATPGGEFITFGGENP